MVSSGLSPPTTTWLVTQIHTQIHFHTGYATVYASYRYQTFHRFICSPFIDLLSVFALICPYISSENTFVHVSVHLVLKFLLYVSTSQLASQLEFFSLCIHSWSTSITLLRHLLSFFPSIIGTSPSFHVLHSPVYVPHSYFQLMFHWNHPCCDWSFTYSSGNIAWLSMTAWSLTDSFISYSPSLYKLSHWKYCHFCDIWVKFSSFSSTVVLRSGAKESLAGKTITITQAFKIWMHFFSLNWLIDWLFCF